MTLKDESCFQVNAAVQYIHEAAQLVGDDQVNVRSRILPSNKCCEYKI